MEKIKVVTYRAPNGDTIDLTKREIRECERSGKWPKNSIGEEYCAISHGLHVVRSGPKSGKGGK